MEEGDDCTLGFLSIIFVYSTQKTKIKFLVINLDLVRRQLGMHGAWGVDRSGTGGGLALLWKEVTKMYNEQELQEGNSGSIERERLTNLMVNTSLYSLC
jgi:hypothetical protein